MSETTTALAKRACPACGGGAVWNPEKQALVCPFCGTVTPGEIKPDGTVEESDLVAALRGVSDDQRGWQSERRTIKCQSCQAVSVFDPKNVGQRCDFCGSSALVPFEEMRAPIRPSSLLPFMVAETQVREQIRAWYGSHWFAPNKLKSKALTDTVHGVYVPFWTFDANAFARWEAESGYHYYTEEAFTDNEGKRKTRRVQHTRWEFSSGSLEHFFDDLLVCASKGIPGNLVSQIEPFPTAELAPYDPAFLEGWVVEQYQIDLVAAAEASRTGMVQRLEAMCASQVPGDTHRNLRVAPKFSDQTFKHVLLPVWLLSYTYGSKRYQVVVNGVTGKIAGDYPIDGWKVALVVFLVLVAFVIFVVLVGGSS